MELASTGDTASAAGVGKAKADDAMESNSAKVCVCIVVYGCPDTRRGRRSEAT